MTLRLISWNINRGGDRLVRQVAALRRYRPDVVCLQEITLACIPVLRDLFKAGGFPFVLDSLSGGAKDLLRGPRRYGQITASRFPLRRRRSKLSKPWPERMLSVFVRHAGAEIVIHNAHIPPGCSNGWIKIQTMNAIYRSLARTPRQPTLLCGDFNAPQTELSDGTLVTWGQVKRSDNSYRFWRGVAPHTGEAWDRGERRVLVGLRRHGFRDVYRELHGYKKQCFSWFWKGKSPAIGRRFDHVFASSSFKVRHCEYLHVLRRRKLSDHSALSVDLALPR